jgi:NADH:ubiquinone reductase (H+-translocating)
MSEARHQVIVVGGGLGTYVGRLIRARLAGRADGKPFAYRDKGSMATIGHLSAVADSYGMKFTGVIGYTMWDSFTCST